MASLFFGMSMYQIGLIILLVSGFLKIQNLEQIEDVIGMTSLLSTSIPDDVSTDTQVYEEWFIHVNVSNKNSSFPDLNKTNISLITDDYKSSFDSGLPVMAYLGICGFAFLDVGYDCTMSVSRAYILESVPKFQHVKLLVMATIVQASSGTIFSLLGVWNISDALGDIFNVDGTSAILVLFCALLFLIVTFGFTSTAFTGHFLTKYSDIKIKEMEFSKQEIIKTSSSDNKNIVTSHRRYYKTKDIDTDIADSVKPLISDYSSENHYGAVTTSSSFTNPNLHLDDVEKSERDSHSQNLQSMSSKLGKVHNIGKSRTKSNSETVPEIDESNCDDKSRTSFQVSQLAETEHDPQSNSDLNKSDHNQSNTFQEKNENAVKRKMMIKLIILVTASFFTMGASMSFLYYAANALTLGIFHGDPMALPGTEGKDLYDQGLRTASLGNLVFYIIFTVTSLINTKLLGIVGEKLLFVIFHLVFAIPLTVLVTTQTIEAYFAALVAMGVYRHTVYTIPFVMANKISQEATGETVTPKSKKSHLGKTMSIIGFVIPTHYLIMSAMMGPVIEATENVWIPLMYSLGCVCLSGIIFCILFLLK